MKVSSEVKMGVIGIVALAVLIWGINYLKGRNILKSTYTLYAFYPESGGLESSAPVVLNGVKIGYVDLVELRTDKNPAIRISLEIEKEYSLPGGSLAELYSADLIGTKAIRMLPSGGTETTLGDSDTLASSIAPDLINTLQAKFFPVVETIGSLAGSMDTLVSRVDSLMAMNAIPETLNHLEVISTSLRVSLGTGGSLDNSFRNLEAFTAMLEHQKEEMSSLIRHLNSISMALDSAGLDRLSLELHNLSHQFSRLLQQVNSGEGSAGKLVYSDSLHLKLEMLITGLDSLIRDLQENPGDYVRLSLFGRSGEKK